MRLSRPIEDLQQPTGLTSSLGGGPPQRRDAAGPRRQEDLEDAAGDREADPLGLGDASHFGLLLRGHLDGLFQASLELVYLALELADLLLKFGDLGLGCGAVDRVDGLLSLAIQGLPGLLAVLSHVGDVPVPAAKDGEGTGEALGDSGHGEAVHRGRSRKAVTIAHLLWGTVHNHPPKGALFEKVPRVTGYPVI